MISRTDDVIAPAAFGVFTHTIMTDHETVELREPYKSLQVAAAAAVEVLVRHMTGEDLVSDNQVQTARMLIELAMQITPETPMLRFTD
jgi:hypothetical protein